MDDLYGNAWGDPVIPDTTTTSSLGSQSTSTSSWVSPKLSHDDEDDLAAPSWSTGTGIKWNEPSEDDHGFGWSRHTDPDLAWGTSVYETIQIGNLSETHTIQEHPVYEEAESFPGSKEETDEEEKGAEATPHQSPHFEEKPLEPPEVFPPNVDEEPPSLPRSPELSQRTPVVSRSPSPDGFGTFTSGFDTAESSISPDPAFALEDDAWGSAWATEATSDDGDQGKGKVVDEWEEAKRMKEKQDRVVPPEVLDEIMSNCDKLCSTLWPDVPSELIDTDKDSWRNRIQSGMEGVEGLEALKKELLPERILQPAVKFNKTTIAKRMAKDIHLTRNLPIVKNSPMSHYLASKGSTAWEDAVKVRKEVSEDDVIPAGWRILEKGSQSPVLNHSKTQKAGGFFSFFSRRDSKVPAGASGVVTPASRRSQSPASAPIQTGTGKATALSERTTSSARASLDSRRSMSVTGTTEATTPSSAVASPASSIPPVQLPAPQPSTSAPSTVSQTPNTGTSSSYADAPEPVFDRAQSPQPAPSAVSRFLGRFGRRRTAVPTSSAHSSIALSSDDLEFLSDIVPSVNDDLTDDPLEQLSRSAAMKAEPLPPVLPPPPLAPPPAPPRVPPPRIESIQPDKTIPPPSLVPIQAGSSKALPEQPPNQSNGFDAFFDSLDFKPMEPEKSLPSSRSSTPKSMGSSPLQPTPASRLPPPLPSSSRPQSPATFAVPTQSSRPASPFTTLPTERPASQPILPPPPSTGSRAQSPITVPLPRRGSSTQPPSTNAKPISRASSALGRSVPHQSIPLRPKVPLSFTIPPPPSAKPSSASSSSGSPPTPGSNVESALPTPTSARPLAELYPHAVRLQSNGTLLPPAQPSSSFMIPPPPSSTSRPHTPGMSSTSTNAITTSLNHNSRTVPPPLPIIAPPPPSQSTPISAGSFDDDDDFSDFQSSATVPSSNTNPLPPIPPPTSSNFRPSQGSTLSATLPGPSSFLAPLPPPPKSSTGAWGFNTPARSNAGVGASGFSSFRTPSPPPLTSQASPSTAFDSSFTSDQGLLPQVQSSGFDDWDNFTTHPLKTPSPPKLPAKTLPPPPQPPRIPPPQDAGSPKPKFKPPPLQKSPPTSPKMRAEHQHTLSLVEMAAARPGQWPAPPSPLPQALAFPFPAPGTGSALGLKGTFKRTVDLMGDDEGDSMESSFGKFGSADKLVAASVSSPAMLSPHSKPTMSSADSMFGSMMKPMNVAQSQSLGTVSSTGSNQWLMNSGSNSSNGSWGAGFGVGTSALASNSTKPAGKSGLSAQDLSFFEGL